MIVLDASVLIAYLDRDDAHHLRAESLLAREIDEDFIVSTLTLAETLVMPARQNRIDAVLDALSRLDVTEQPFPGDAAGLAQLRTATGRKMPDCCVLLAAEQAGARVATFDEGLIKAAAARAITTVGE